MIIIELFLTLFHTGTGAIQRSYLYTCKNVVGD
jgi:hypothetical protein